MSQSRSRFPDQRAPPNGMLSSSGQKFSAAEKEFLTSAQIFRVLTCQLAVLRFLSEFVVKIVSVRPRLLLRSVCCFMRFAGEASRKADASKGIEKQALGYRGKD